MEIDQEAKGDIKQLHVTQELGFVNRQNPFYGFRLYQNATFD
jgi:hypothetical protein